MLTSDICRVILILSMKKQIFKKGDPKMVKNLTYISKLNNFCHSNGSSY